MTKTERIQQLERLVADLSYRLYRLETNNWRGYGQVYLGPYWYYSNTGATTNLATGPFASSTGSVPPKETTFESRLGSNSG